MREGRLVLAAAGGALLCAVLSGCACGCPRPPGIPPIYPRSHLAFSAPSACCDVDPREGRTVRDELWTQGEAFALTFGINEGLKYLVGRQRPDLTDFLSFPSGHTSTAFCAATLIMRNSGPAVGVPAYGVAFLTGF